MTDWRPIETLEYNKGVLFSNSLLLSPFFRVGKKIQIVQGLFKKRVIDAYEFDSGLIVSSESDRYIYPTHWMPLPERPTRANNKQ